MSELERAIAASLSDTTYKCILSAPVKKDAPFRKVVCDRETGGFRIEK